MHAPFFQVDAFADRLFAGNPAAVILLDAYPEDSRLQAMAAENNLAETAFLTAAGDAFALRWFTPTVEVPLCGHATLASAAVVMERLSPGRSSVVFNTLSGPLTASRSPVGYRLDLPRRSLSRRSSTPALEAALGAVPAEVFSDGGNLMVRFEDAGTVRELRPEFAKIRALEVSGVIVTAADAGPYDFVSRYFAPAKGVDEDSVTGAAHCALAPFWGERLDKSDLIGFQASRRGGVVRCRPRGERVELEGGCVFYLEGRVWL